MPSPAQAAVYVTDEEFNYQAVILADSDTDPTWSIEIRRSLTFDEQDQALGMDTYCLVVPPGTTSYGGLDRVELSNDVLHLSLLQKAQAELDTDAEIIMDLQLSPAARRDLYGSSHPIRGSRCLVCHASRWLRG